MRATTFGAFVSGFALGMMVLAAALWVSGGLNIARSAPQNTTAAPVDRPAHNQPAHDQWPTEGGADRAFPEDCPDHPIVPVTGVSAGSIEGTFYDNYDGHENGALDIPAASGTPVIAAVDGSAVELFRSTQYGTTLYQFDVSEEFCYSYANLDGYAPGLTEGTLLRRGQVLGYVGSSGGARRTSHLRFGVSRLGPDKSWWKGTPIDPLPLLR